MKSAVVVLLVLAGTLGVARTSSAETGVVRVMIAGALAAPMGTSGDGQITLRLGVGLSVFLVSGNAVTPGSLGAATFAQWTDTTPATGFGSPSNLMVFRLGGGFMVVAAGIATSGGLVTTFSATSPAQKLSGTWTLASGTGVTGAGANDAVVTFTYDTNPGSTSSNFVRAVADGYLPAVATKTIQGLAGVDVVRNIPLRPVVSNNVGPQVGTLVSYSAHDIVGNPSEFIALTGINIGGIYVLYACAFPQLPGGIACPIGGTGLISHLSGNLSEAGGQSFMMGPQTIVGVDAADLVLTLFPSLP
jgi:hypothetical protein